MPVFSKLFNPFAWFSGPVAILRGHSGSVMALSFSPNVKYVASGGSDCVMIWDTSSWKSVPISKQSYTERAQVSCVAWLTRRNEPVDTLCYGNIHGYLVFLQYSPVESRFKVILSTRIAQGAEIISISSRVSGTDLPLIVLCTRDKCIQVWSFDTGSHKLSPIFSKLYPNDGILPRTVAFDNNPDHDIFVFGMYDGNLYKHSGKDADLISKHQLSLQIGYAVVDTERRLCVVDNVGDGFNLYKLDTGVFIKTLITKDPIKTHPKGVAFASQSLFIVGGSDHGLAYVFDRKTGDIVTTFHYASVGGAETIAACDTNDGKVLIGVASTTSAGPALIKIWKWKPITRNRNGRISLKQLAIYMLQAAIIGAALAYCYETFQKLNIRKNAVPWWRAPWKGVSRWSDL